MKTDDLRESQNVEDRRGQASSSYNGSSGSSGGGMLLQLLFQEVVGKQNLLL